MVSSRFQLGVLVRISLLIALITLLAFVLAYTGWFFTPLVTGVLIIVAVWDLVRHLNKTNRNLNEFLVSLQQSGYSTRFPESGSEIHRTFNAIIEEFQKLGAEKESQLQFLNTLTENLRVGLMCFNPKGDLVWMNPEARRYIGRPLLRDMEDLRKSNRALHDEIVGMMPGQTLLMKWQSVEKQEELSIHYKSIIIQKETLDIFLIQNVQVEMDAKEVEAWQKLTRVMRHEIMNSMTPIVSLTEAVNQVLNRNRSWTEENKEEYEDVLESLDAVESRSKQLLKFVNAYKDFATTPQIVKEEFEVAGLLDELQSLMHQELDNRNVSMNVAAKPPGLRLNGDKKLLSGILINLVKNSLEAMTDEAGKITISARSYENGQVRLVVEDDGQGIPQDLQDKVFVPFFTTKEGGSGIGLSLSRQLIHLHGGSITVESQPGVGTRFEIFL